MASRRSGRHEGEGGVRFSRTLFIALLVLSGALIAFDRPASRSQAFAAFRAAFTDIAAPVLELAAQPIRTVKNIGPHFRSQSALAEENAQLRQQLIEARYWEDLAYRQRDRIEVYESILNVRSPATEDRIGAWTVADPEGPFVRARLIGRGRESGVANGYPVINLYGLVGRVYETGRRSSRILLLTDLNSRIPVMADRSNSRAILVGDNSPFPRLEYVGRQPDIQEGDRIVSSGDGGVLPRGLPVGEAVPTRDGGWRVRLYSDQAPVDFVWVWPYQRALAPEEELQTTVLPVTESADVPDAAGAGEGAEDNSVPATASAVDADAPQTPQAVPEQEQAEPDTATAATGEDVP